MIYARLALMDPCTAEELSAAMGLRVRDVQRILTHLLKVKRKILRRDGGLYAIRRYNSTHVVCKRKIRFNSIEEALGYGMRMEARGAPRTHAYVCPHCAGVHRTSRGMKKKTSGEVNGAVSKLGSGRVGKEEGGS